jgi:hypothetical protein
VRSSPTARSARSRRQSPATDLTIAANERILRSG